ncbi:USP6 N-terminal-like protein [Ochotona princeps]|uniref:USP6 N-terminal-like protein n=1 Tax=Ochotona princeps TaxID=9978 RepID=UPI0027148D4B|nr:USP6 N-terminal-like protein [Ochotona princeps]
MGYRKGLSHLAAMLLMWMGEEDAFWALVQLMEDKKYGLRDVYKPGSGTLEDLQKRLQHVIHQALPALEKHLEEQSISLGSITKHWFTQCFLEIVPFSLAIRLWDVFLLEGQQMLTTMAYTTLKVHQKRLQMMSTDDLQEFLQETLKKTWALDDDVVIKKLQGCKRELAKLKCPLPAAEKPKAVGSPARGGACISLRSILPSVALKRKNSIQESKGRHPEPAAPPCQEPTGDSASPLQGEDCLESYDSQANLKKDAEEEMGTEPITTASSYTNQCILQAHKDDLSMTYRI